MTGIAKDIVSEIMKHRSVYIVFKQELYIEYTKAEVLGVYYSQQEACLALLDETFSTDLSLMKEYLVENLIKNYDPNKRFYQRRFNMFTHVDLIWHDRWKASKAVSRYEIQEWIPGSKFVEVNYFNFDKWFKSHIYHTFFDTNNQQDVCQYIRDKLTHWHDLICIEKSLPIEFEITPDNTLWDSERVEADYESINREIWLKRFGDPCKIYDEYEV